MNRQGIEERVFGKGVKNAPKLIVLLTSSTYFTVRGAEMHGDIKQEVIEKWSRRA